MASLRKRDGIWYVRLSDGFDPVTGKRRQTEVSTGCSNRADAELVAAQVVARAAAGVRPSTDRSTVAEWLQRWMEDEVANNTAPSTQRSYRTEIEHHIAPMIGRAMLRDLQPADLSSMYAAARRKGLAPSHVSYLHRIMHRSLQVAMEWGLVARNVADAVQAPRVPHVERPILTVEQAKALLAHVRGHRLYGLYAVALETGLREGELCARRWRDFDGRFLAVATKLQREKGKGLVEGPTKARRPRTRVPLSPAAVGILEDHRAEQEHERALAGSAWDGDDWIWAWEDGRAMDPGWVSKHFHRLVGELGFPKGMRFHDLRHTSAALGAAHGEPLEVIADRLGHRDRRTTLSMYGHHMPAAADEAASRRGELLFPSDSDRPRRGAR